MFKTLQTLMLASAAVALSACGGGGGGGGSESSSAPTPPAAMGVASVSTSLSAASVTSPAGTVVLTVTLTNVGGVAVSGGTLTIPLPAGTKSTSAFAVGSPCTSTGFSVGTSGFALTGLSMPVGATCTNTITLTPSTPGTFVFTPSGLTAIIAGTKATLTIN